MPRRKKSSNKTTKSSRTEVTVSRPENDSNKGNLLERLQADLENRQSLISLVLGVLIVVVLGVLLFNYFNNKQTGDLGPSQQAQNNQDVKKENLPGSYTVKEGDTLFTIAEDYYDDGYKFTVLAEENKLSDVNLLTVGQVLTIPKLDSPSPSPTSEATPSPSSTVMPTASPSQMPVPTPDEKGGQGGAINQTVWGEKIDGATYTVVEGDWLSKISGRAYGDIYAFDKIAKANNISDPNLIETGTVLKIPR